MSLVERDKKVIWHPFTPQKKMPQPIAVKKAYKSILVDEFDKEYIDAISSWWVTIHGHAHPYIAQKIYEQALELEQVIFAGFTHKPAVTLAEALINILPTNFSKIFYSDNGSTATEVALKMAIQFWWNKKELLQENVSNRNKILAFNNSYHGDTFGAMSVSDRSVFTLAFHDKLFDVIFIDTPTHENIHQIISTIEKEANNIAAFIYEPLVQGAGGMLMYNEENLQAIITACKQHEIICIADEVMTGFGRTGKLFASEYLHEKPDIICLSKGLTGGTMALGVTACTQKIYDAFVHDNKLSTFFHGHSFTANPIACSAAIASIELLKLENTSASITAITNSNEQFYNSLLHKNFSVIKNIRMLGTILAFDIAVGKTEYLNNIATTITQFALNNGVYLRPLGNTVYIMPPYCITTQELHKIYTVIEMIINQYEQ